MQPEAGKVVAGRYRLERPLASGGMGAVWVARHLQLDVPVAVKFMFDEMRTTASGSARFLREAKAAARLRSPHIVRAYDYDLTEGTPYIAMELLEGESLDQRIRRDGKLTPTETSSILRQIAKGLREAHELGIVHRDLKPANIFLASVGEDEIVKVLDFGIAKDTKELLVDDTTASGAVLGSPHHMSPEQARGAEVDARSDLWSLAVVVFQCITGERPFAGKTMGDIIARICGDAIPTPSAFAPELGLAVDRFFERALARNPAMRFQSAREMADAFDDAIGVPPGSEARPRRGSAASSAHVQAAPRTEETRVANVQAGATYAGDSVARDLPDPPLKRSLSRYAVPVLALVAVATTWYAISSRPVEPSSTPVVDADVRAPAASDAPPAPSAAPVVSPEEAPSEAAPQPSTSAAGRPPPNAQRVVAPRPTRPPPAGDPRTPVPVPSSRGPKRPDDKFF